MNDPAKGKSLPAAIPKVFLVDDEPAVRRALTRLIRAAGLDAESYRSADELLEAIRPQAVPSCLVADLRLPGLSGLDLQDELHRRGVDTPIIFISGRADVGSGIRAMKAGAVDFLEKPIANDILREAIEAALEQDRKRRAAQADRAVLEVRAARLTPREREVFALVVTGLLNKQVGGQLGATEKTIKVHRARVMEKMGARSLAELVRMADRLGIADASMRVEAEGRSGGADDGGEPGT
jgi:FixJ family two-component response regulator